VLLALRAAPRQPVALIQVVDSAGHPVQGADSAILAARFLWLVLPAVCTNEIICFLGSILWVGHGAFGPWVSR
jgi:hypothetical protein